MKMTPNKRQKLSLNLLSVKDHLHVFLKFLNDKESLIFARTCKFLKIYIYTYHRFTDPIEFKNTSHLSNVSHIDLRVDKYVQTEDIRRVREALTKKPFIIGGIRLTPEIMALDFVNVHTLLNIREWRVINFGFKGKVRHLSITINTRANMRNIPRFKFGKLRTLDITDNETGTIIEHLYCYPLGVFNFPKALEQVTFKGRFLTDVITQDCLRDVFTHTDEKLLFDPEIFFRDNCKITHVMIEASMMLKKGIIKIPGRMRKFETYFHFSEKEVIIDLTEASEKLELIIGSSQHMSFVLPDLSKGFIKMIPTKTKKLKALTLKTWMTKSMNLNAFERIEHLTINRHNILENSRDQRIFECKKELNDNELEYMKTMKNIGQFTFVSNCFTKIDELCIPAGSGMIKVWNRLRKNVNILGGVKLLEILPEFRELDFAGTVWGKFIIPETVKTIVCNNDGLDMIGKIPDGLKRLIVIKKSEEEMRKLPEMGKDCVVIMGEGVWDG